MRVLGIDPGTRFMGFGVVEESRGQLTHIGHGVIRTDPSQALELRLRTLHSELGRAVALFRPHAMAVEGVFTCRNARSALILGHARGVALLAASQADLRVFEYAPARVKRSVGAGGAAAKDAVARMVKTFLKMESLERADATDALAVAICHLNHCRSGVSPPVPRKTGPKSSAAAFADRLSPAYRRFGSGA